jgi:glucosyl-3-phosphoglycerate synthase
MTNFAQKHTKLTTFYQMTAKADLLQQLVGHSRWKKPVLIIPSLATEFNDPENRPIFENIIHELRLARYLEHIIIGVDKADEDDIQLLREIMAQQKVRNFFIQWNDGPGFSDLYKRLEDSGIDLSIRGKGRNLFMGFGTAIAMGASSVGLLDADIKTFKRPQLDRLFYPVAVLNYQFSKAYYARWDGRHMFGRVKRLLLDPLLLALKRKFTESREEKMIRLIDFLLSFNYQLSGEVAIETGLLKRMRYASHWGIEIFTLIEAWRKANQVAQVEFTKGAFDHKHQPLSTDDAKAGLHKMAVDIVTTLFRALIIEEGLEVSDHFFRDLAVTYTSIAEDQIKKYSDNARFNGLEYDRDKEEHTVQKVFAKAVIFAGFILESPQHIAETIIRFVTSHEEFKPFIDQGLLAAVTGVEKRLRQDVLIEADLPSWERVQEKDPDIIKAIIDVIEDEKVKYGPLPLRKKR